MRSEHILWMSTVCCLSTAGLLVSGCGGGSPGGGNHNNPPPSAPTVTATTPANAATGISISSPNVTATFSEAMTASTISGSTFTLSNGASSVSGTVSYASGIDQATFTSSAPLAANTTYTATITTGAESSAGIALAANYAWTFTTAAPPTPVAVNFASSGQTIRGFGGATAWLGQLTTQQATALFSPTNGLGLSILRVRIDPGGSAASNWVTGQWTTELANATEATATNPNAIVFASPWTPPISMKNSSTSQPYYSPACSPQQLCGGFLVSSSYAAYAAYLEDFVSYFQANGVNLYAISMQNEPDYANVNYESCYWTPQQMDSWIAGNASVLTTRLIMPESFAFIPSQAAAALSDPNAESLVSIVGGHIYGTNPAFQSQAEGLGKDVWMTEHSLSPAGAQPAIGDAIAMAEEIHNSLVTGQFNAYVWWWIWDNPADGINYGLIDSNTSVPSPTYFGYAIEQFSRFIQPGWVRVTATASSANGNFVSAYTGGGHIAIVAINSNSSAVSQPFTLQNTSAASLTPYQTNANAGFQGQAAVAVSGGQFTYTLPAQSITTFYQ